MKIKKIFITLFALGSLFAFLSCGNVNAAKNDQIKINLSIASAGASASAGARYVSIADEPNCDDVTKWTVSFTNEFGEVVKIYEDLEEASQSFEVTTEVLPEGYYTVSASGATESGIVYAGKTENVVIEAGTTIDVSIMVGIKTSDSTGSLSVRIFNLFDFLLHETSCSPTGFSDPLAYMAHYTRAYLVSSKGTEQIELGESDYHYQNDTSWLKISEYSLPVDCYVIKLYYVDENDDNTEKPISFINRDEFRENDLVMRVYEGKTTDPDFTIVSE